MNLARLVATFVLAPMLLVTAAGAGDAHAQGHKNDPRRPEAPKNDPAKGESQKTEASHLKSAADVLMDQDRYADALVLYQRAYELSSDPALLYNQGRALEALGDYPAALEKLEAFEREAPPAVRARVPGLKELITDLRGRIATIVVRTNAPAARLLVRQKDEGIINAEKRISTRAGSASVEVDAEGYESFHRELDLSAGATVVVEATLTPKKRDALVVVRTMPSADVLFDGKALGRSPLQVRATPGSHELVARADGYYEQRVPMTLALGDRRDVELEMKATPGLASRWWFWTGIAVVVAGGVATAIVLTTERPHSNGTFAPGSVSGP
jgi:tetratricopeptide (TPR) repeat protein